MRYSIVSIDFPYVEDSSQTKNRPALCLTIPQGKYQLIAVAQITSKVDDPMNTDVLLEARNCNLEKVGLLRTSTIKLSRVTTISALDVKGVVGLLPQEWEKEVENKLKLMFQI